MKVEEGPQLLPQIANPHFSYLTGNKEDNAHWRADQPQRCAQDHHHGKVEIVNAHASGNWQHDWRQQQQSCSSVERQPNQDKEKGTEKQKKKSLSVKQAYNVSSGLIDPTQYKNVVEHL